MGRIAFNPVGLAVNLAIGWFFLSFLQSAARVLLGGDRAGLAARFRSIAFFHDGRAAALNIAIILAIGVVANVLWRAAHRG